MSQDVNRREFLSRLGVTVGAASASAAGDLAIGRARAEASEPRLGAGLIVSEHNLVLEQANSVCL